MAPAPSLPTHHFNSAWELRDTSLPRWDLQGSQESPAPRRGSSEPGGEEEMERSECSLDIPVPE